MKKNIQKAIRIYKEFNNSVFWLNELVKQGLINKAEAGLIVLNHS